MRRKLAALGYDTGRLATHFFERQCKKNSPDVWFFLSIALAGAEVKAEFGPAEFIRRYKALCKEPSRKPKKAAKVQP